MENSKAEFHGEGATVYKHIPAFDREFALRCPRRVGFWFPHALKSSATGLLPDLKGAGIAPVADLVILAPVLRNLWWLERAVLWPLSNEVQPAQRRLWVPAW